MKRITVILAAIFCSLHFASFAQCDKNIIMTASKTEYLDTAGNITRTVEEKSTIEISKDKIVVIDGNNPRMSGTVLSKKCSWSKAYKVGKSVYEARIERSATEVMNVTVVIEGKKDKVSLLFTVKEKPDRIIRVYADTFEEAK